MYTPEYNRLTDQQEAADFMRKYSFATIVTVAGGVPSATHLPFIVEQRNSSLVLISHFAKANHQSADIFECRPLVIFMEPHAYISPAHYEKEQNVPTWNYLAVHAYGKAVSIDNAAQVLEKTITFYEAGYLEQWNSLADDYKFKMMNGIVAFEILVDEIQGKKKLSQNRKAAEQQNIIDQFSRSDNKNEQTIAKYMSTLKQG